MEKGGLSWIFYVLIALCLIVIIFIGFNLYSSYRESEALRKEINPDPNKDFNYYLPADFAVVKVSREGWSTKVTGVVLVFYDVNNKQYRYETSDYPSVYQTKNYLILKDDLSPKPAADWDFLDVKAISLRYIIEASGRESKDIYSIQVNTDRKSDNFQQNCWTVAGEEGGTKITCE